MQRTRRRRTAITLGVVLAVFGWLILFGHHRHAYEVRSCPSTRGEPFGDLLFRIRSRRSPFEVTAAAGGPTGADIVAGYSDVFRLANEVEPRRIGGWGVIHSVQVLLVDEPLPTIEFRVNGVPFHLSPKGMDSEGRHWDLSSDSPIDILLDEMKAAGAR